MSSTMDALLDFDAPLLQVPDYATPGDIGYSARDYLMPDLCNEKKSYRRLWLGMGLTIVALYAVVVFAYFGAADQGVDQNAYLVGGRMLAEHFNMKYTLPNPYSYVGGMYVRLTPVDSVTGNPIPGGDYFPKYPFGLPLLYACFFWAFKFAAALPFIGRHVDPSQAAYWAFLVSPLSSIFAVAGTFFLARQVAGSFAGALAAILLGSSQLMMILADNPNSHASCVAFIVWGMFFCVRWLQTGSIWRGILGGLLVGYAATIRYNEGLLFITMCVVVLSRWRWDQWKNWRSLTLTVALAAAGYLVYLQVDNAHAAHDGLEALWSPQALTLNLIIVSVLAIYGIAMLALSFINLSAEDWLMYVKSLVPGLAWSVPVAVLMITNHHTMGSFAGYDTTHESEFGVAFQWKFFWQNWEKVLREFHDMGLFFVLPFAVGGVFMAFRRSWRLGLMLITWIVPGVMLYMSYYWSPDFSDAYARFFLTYLPALLVGAAICFSDGVLAGRKVVDRFDSPAAKVSIATVLCWLLPGVAICAVHYLHSGRDNQLMDMGLIYVPVAMIVIAALVHEVSLLTDSENPDRYKFGGVSLTIAAGVVVAIASGVSMFRTIHGLREGTQSMKIPLHDFRDRLSLAQTGQELLANVPAKSVLFSENTGGIATPANYIQFLRDWEMYSLDAFSLEGARRGFGGGGGNRNNRNNRNGNGNGNNFRGNGGGNGGGGGRNNFGGPGGGGPGGGGFGGPGGGGGGGGMAVANNNTNDPNAAVATPVQPEQREYQASLYKGKKAEDLYKLEAAVINKAFAEKRRVFAVVAKEHSTESNSGFGLFGGGGLVASDPLGNFRDDLKEVGKYQVKVITRWQDVSLPEEKPEDFALTDNNPMGGGGRGAAVGFARQLMSSDRVMDWQLVEITALVPAKTVAAK